MDRWQTFPIEFKGGLMTNMTPLQQGINFPGSAILMRNFEPSVEGGYRRIEGYTKWDDDQVTGSAAMIRGVAEYKQEVYAAVGDGLYKSNGTTGWTEVTDNATYSSSGINLGGASDVKVRFAKHHFGTTKVLIIVDSTGKPFKFDGTTFSQITSATGDQTGAELVAEHKNHLFFAKDTTLSFSAPFDDEDFTPASGAGTIEFDNEITGIHSFREQLIVFTKHAIFAIGGSSIADFQVNPITRDLGAIEPDTVQEIGGDLMFLGPDGLRLLSATERNNDFGLGVVSKVIQPEMTSFTGSSSSYSSLVIREKSQYRIFGYNSSYTDANARGVIGTQFAQQGGEGMAWAETRGINAYCSSSDYVEDEEWILFGNDDGYVYRMESGNSFDGTDITATFKTPYLAITDPNTRKNVYKTKVFVDPQGGFSATMDIEYDFNDDNIVQPDSITLDNTASTASFYGLSTYGSGGYGGGLKYVFDVPTVGSGYVASISFESTSSDPPYSLDAVVLTYGQYGRR